MTVADDVFDLPLEQITFAALDFETTGLSPERDRIVEIGAVRMRGGLLIDTFSVLVNPGMPIPEGASEVHGIRDADVADQPREPDLIPKLMDYLGDAVIIAHNAEFDLGFLRASIRRCSLTDPGCITLDTIQIARRAFPRRWSYSLQNLAFELGLEVGSAHRALDDAQLCMSLFVASLLELSDRPARTLRRLLAAAPGAMR